MLVFLLRLLLMIFIISLAIGISNAIRAKKNNEIISDFGRKSFKTSGWVFILIIFIGILRSIFFPDHYMDNVDMTKISKESLEAAVYDAIGEKSNNDKNSIRSIKNEDGIVTLKLNGPDALSQSTYKNTLLNDTTRILKNLRDTTDDIDFINIKIVWYTPLTDVYGKDTDKKVMKLDIAPTTIDEIDFDNFDSMNLEKISDDYYEHPALKN